MKTQDYRIFYKSNNNEDEWRNIAQDDVFEVERSSWDVHDYNNPRYGNYPYIYYS